MAYRRCISVRTALLARGSSPSFGYVSRENDLHKPEEFRSNIQEYLTRRTSSGSNVKSGSWRYCASVFREGSRLVEGGLCMSSRYMSTSTRDIADVLTDATTEAVTSQASTMSEVATVLSDVPAEAVASQVPAISEVAIAAADSSFPVAALQYLIDGVHTYTGLNWWASIAFTTLLFRGATIPLLMQSYEIYALVVVPRLIEVRQKLRAAAGNHHFEIYVDGFDRQNFTFFSFDSSAHFGIISKHAADMNGIFRAHPSFLLHFVGLCGCQGSLFIGFYFAITNMAEQVPSFESGGAFWFTDLTTPDAMFILPILTALTYWCRPEIKLDGFPAEYYEGANICYTVGTALVSAAALSAMNFPQALYFSWITSNVFMCCFHYYLKLSGVEKAWGLPGRARKP